MKVPTYLKLLFIVTLIDSIHSLTIRDFSSEEIHDIEPVYTDYAAVARYVVHKSAWASMGTISTLKSIDGFPMVNIISVADSAKGENSTGHVYFYLTNLDYTGQDLMKNNKLTVLFSNDQDLACTKRGLDPMEPTCARIILSGSAAELNNGTEEYQFAYRAFLSRHPAASRWIRTHSFYLCKLDIVQIVVLDYYGGPHYVTSEDYYKANTTSTNGFLNEISPDAIEFVQNNHILNEQRTIVSTKNDDDRIKIKINKDTVAINIQLSVT